MLCRISSVVVHDGCYTNIKTINYGMVVFAIVECFDNLPVNTVNVS